MNECAPESNESASRNVASLELRHAQRAFAILLDERSASGEFRFARLRRNAGRTLSALSADDRALLSDWLSLQLAAHAETGVDGLLGVLGRVDSRVAARVRRALPHRIEALAQHVQAERIVAAQGSR
ncbi:MAG: hypothetical protein ACREPX_15760 [Rhodanobacteraceae bacterium]